MAVSGITQKADIFSELFDEFDRFLRRNGFEAQKGQIIDASIVSVPKQRNSREENRKIKAGEEVTGWSASKQRQKDTDASIHDSQVFKDLLDDRNTSGAVWADSAYRSYDNLWHLEVSGYREYIQRKGHRNHPLTEREKQGNRIRSRTRSRVEHVFGIQVQRAGNLILRSIGKSRACLKIRARNLAYNLDRYSLLASGAWKMRENILKTAYLDCKQVQMSCSGQVPMLF